jgi:hypothetical protein
MAIALNDPIFNRFRKKPPASLAEIEQCQSRLNFALPADYVALMREMNGGEGFVGEGGYLMLWPIEELIRHNLGYESTENVPGLFLFGSNGGGEAYAFDTRLATCPIVMVPFIVMEFEALIPIAPDIESFLRKLPGGKHDVWTG